MNSRIYTTLYQLKNIKSLDEIENWSSNIFNSPVKHSKNHEREFIELPVDEKYYKYRWGDFSEIHKLQVVLDGKEISFVEATAEIEYSKRKIFDSSQHFLPKADRLNTEEINVLFFELNKNIYVIIQTSNTNQINRVLDLIGQEHVKGQDWHLSDDLFNWLVFIYSEQQGQLSSKITISSISGFTGTVFDNENIVSSKSMETIKLIATRAFISTGGNLKEVSIILKDSDNCSLSCKLNSNCDALIYVNDSVAFTKTNGLEKAENFILYVYTYLIPLLRNGFLKNKSIFTTEDKKKFAKKIGIDVVNEVIRKNNIQSDDLMFN